MAGPRGRQLTRRAHGPGGVDARLLSPRAAGFSSQPAGARICRAERSVADASIPQLARTALERRIHRFPRSRFAAKSGAYPGLRPIDTERFHVLRPAWSSAFLGRATAACR